MRNKITNRQEGKTGIFILLLVFVAVALLFVLGKKPAETPPTNDTVVVELTPIGTSNISGTARISTSTKGTTVNIALQDKEGTPRPVHIHNGTCSNLGNIAFQLNDVVNGTSETIVPVSIESLQSLGPFAINVHKSQDEIQTSIACGNVPQTETTDKAESPDNDNTQQENEKENTDTGKEDETSADNKNTNSEPVTINFTNNGFEPKTITVPVGTTVTWNNKSGKRMWVASDFHPTHKQYSGTSINEHCPNNKNAFDACAGSPPGSSWSFTFDKKGEWKYHEHLTGFSFTGTVIVE